MATTLQSLKTYYDNVMRSDFAHIPATHQTLLANLSTQVDGGALTLAAAQAQVVKLAIDTTSVASLAYNFFTGSTPFHHGFDYLVSAGGANPNNLNSAYYQAFNVDNRYINFAMNLGKAGEGATWFNANYGALTMSQAVSKAYAEIFGITPDATKVNALLNDQVPNGQGGTYTRQQYFASYGGDGLEGVGTKAAMVGWLLAAAAKEDIGTYAKANDAFLADLALDGVALFRSGLVAAYGTPAPGTTGVTLTVAGDKSVSPTATDPTLKSTANNDTITVTGDVAAGVTIDAGAGRDTITAKGVLGTLTTTDGGDTLVLNDVLSTPAGLGVPAQFGSVTLGADNNVVTLKGLVAAGTSLTAAGTNNVLHVDHTGYTSSVTSSGTISGFQTIYMHSPTMQKVEGATVIYSVISAPEYAGQNANISVNNKEVVVLKDTSNGANVGMRAPDGGGAKADVHLQNFTGAPTTAVSHFANGYAPNGGVISFVVGSDAAPDRNATLVLHVDSNSTAGLIYGYSSVPSGSGNFRGPLDNLTIVGAGKLTAQIASNFVNVDATQAGDLTLTYEAKTSTTAQTFRLGDGTNDLSIYFSGNATQPLTPAAVKFYLGAGTDTIRLATTAIESPGDISATSSSSLNNLHIRDNVTLNAPPEIIGFQKGVDHLVLDAQAHALTANVQTYADGKATLTDALLAVSANVAGGTVAVFTWNGDTYVYAQDASAGVTMGGIGGATGDGLIKLVGVTGLTVGTGAGSYDIHYG